MFVHHRTRAIVLKKVDHKENDQLFTLYTKDFGKINVIGRGIRKISSKLRPSIDIFYLTKIEFVRGKTYNTLIGVNLLDNFNRIHGDLSKLSTAHTISDVLDELIYSKEKEDKLWTLISDMFDKLEQGNFTAASLKLFYFWFLWKLFSVLGYKPKLYKCASCNETLKPRELHFNSAQGGVVCSSCFKLTGGLDISLETIKMLRVIIEDGWSKTDRLKIKKEYLEDLQRISENYLNYLGQKRRFE
jgi:DNA repair protein RecO (recombination protein O)